MRATVSRRDRPIDSKVAISPDVYKEFVDVAKIGPSWLTSGTRRLILLAPEGAVAPEAFSSPVYDPDLYDELLAGMQRLRGSTYASDGAIRPSDLTEDGRHLSPADRKAWHVLVTDSGNDVCGCARYLAYDNNISFDDLNLKTSALAQDSEWGPLLRLAVENEIALARDLKVAYAEVGGWALHDRIRFSSEALRIALTTYALSRTLGGSIGISTVTVRHCSSAILQRIGGAVLSFAGRRLPLYYDPQYQCEMSILRFEAHQANPRYETSIENLRAQMDMVPVVAKAPATVPYAVPRPVFACA